MSVKIRLSRQGRKKVPYYHIVVADSRAPRDGKFIENIGYYKPQTVPATIELNVERAAAWLAKGAQPTDTCRAILSYKGVLYKHHLDAGVRKGALTQEQADAKYNEWVAKKEQKVASHGEKHQMTLAERRAAALAEETRVKEARAQKLAEKLAAFEAAKAASEAEATAPAEETPAAEMDAPAAETEAPATDAAETPAE